MNIVLTTLNATYQHCAFGLRYLYANLGELQPQAQIAEYTIAEDPRDVAERLMALSPKVIGFGVYIWNTEPTRRVIEILKKSAPEITIVIGGPEVSYEIEDQAICALADHIVCGEGEDLFRELCGAVLTGKSGLPKIWRGELPNLETLALPYQHYSDSDIQNRTLYVEASRGCPYKCEFCLSSLDKVVRSVPLEKFLAELDTLIARGARGFKFVDRTFNLNLVTTTKILEFFLARASLGIFAHFELVPDRLPTELRELIRRFPEGSLQFEIGIQTFDPEVSRHISRRQDYAKTEDNIRYLSTQTKVHLHTDLIVGLPGETLETFQKGFDQLISFGPQEIQVGILKYLRGTPIARHNEAFQMHYQSEPPYTVIRTKDMDFQTIQTMVRFAKFWDLIANSGHFPATLALLKTTAGDSFFLKFLALSRFLNTRHPQRYGVALVRLVESLWVYFETHSPEHLSEARLALTQDYCGQVKRDVPEFLRDGAGLNEPVPTAKKSALPRQQRHRAASLPSPSSTIN